MKHTSGSGRRITISPVVYLLLACLPLFFAIPAQTQVYAGSITGLVQDSSGAVLPNATVTLTDSEKGLKYSAKTDSSGRYLLRALPPSTYSVRIEATGFSSEVQNGVVLD